MARRKCFDCGQIGKGEEDETFRYVEMEIWQCLECGSTNTEKIFPFDEDFDKDEEE